ncbi:hypothetical protein IPC177_02060 [Pseudomonas aeruginosa]|nr:hypothetical protein IPC177_02060 [Pseudomonas aeruginosa]
MRELSIIEMDIVSGGNSLDAAATGSGGAIGAGLGKFGGSAPCAWAWRRIPRCASPASWRRNPTPASSRPSTRCSPKPAASIRRCSPPRRG